jgi:PAS domain-containing protein
MLLVATTLLIRDHLRLDQHATALEARVEHLQDRIWQLAESEAQHRSLVEAQADLMVERDAQGRILFANDGYARLLGTRRPKPSRK